MQNNYFYGVDYKKLKLYCQIKDIQTYYELQKYLKCKFNWEKTYEVLVDDREDNKVEFEVLTDQDKPMRLKINYYYINFFYFFENMEEQEKVYLNDCIRE